MAEAWKARVLIVEDSPEIREALQEILEYEGYRVDSVGTAEDGLDRLKSDHFDLVVSDYTLPEHNGAWLLSQAVLAGRLDEHRGILVTAHPQPNSDGFKVLSKPINFDEFLGEVEARSA
ncbi:MAG: response regulator [Myxococcota bacterium]|nr:response regulator [Myxococcota bacterium]